MLSAVSPCQPCGFVWPVYRPGDHDEFVPAKPSSGVGVFGAALECTRDAGQELIPGCMAVGNVFDLRQDQAGASFPRPVKWGAVDPSPYFRVVGPGELAGRLSGVSNAIAIGERSNVARNSCSESASRVWTREFSMAIAACAAN